MRFRTPDGALSLAVFDCCNGVFIVADKYLIQIHHLAELAFSFLKHQKFPKYLISRTLAFFYNKKSNSDPACDYPFKDLSLIMNNPALPLCFGDLKTSGGVIQKD